MSAYVNFYLRVNDKLAPIGSYSRSNMVYEITSHVLTWEKLIPITRQMLDNWRDEAEDKKQHVIDAKKADEKKCAQIMAANNSLDDKLDAVARIEEDYDEMDAFIDECSYTADFFCYLSNIIDDYQYSSDEAQFENDYNHYIYAGIEASGKIENIVADK